MDTAEETKNVNAPENEQNVTTPEKTEELSTPAENTTENETTLEKTKEESGSEKTKEVSGSEKTKEESGSEKTKKVSTPKKVKTLSSCEFEEAEKVTVVIRARRTEPLDAPYIHQLAQPWTDKLFGRVNIVNVIEKSILAVTLMNEKEEAMGHAAFYNYPNLPDISPSEWEAWMGTLYAGSGQFTALNTLFLHYFVALPEYATLCAREILNVAYNVMTDLLHVFLVVPAGLKELPDASVASVFKPLSRPGTPLKNSKHRVVYACCREDHVPQLHVRKARVEDHDDVMSVFGDQTDSLRELYGDFFVAELIDAQDDGMHCLVAESDGVPVGFMSLSDDVNYTLLNNCFELAPYHGLRKPNKEDVLDPPHNKESYTRIKIVSQLKSDVQMLKDSLALSGHKTWVVDSGFEKKQKIDHSDSMFVPLYFGKPNAFSIQLFGIDQKHEMRSCDFLTHAFVLFPDFDFCIITIHNLVPVYPLIQGFVRITPRCFSTLPQELYVFHRSGLVKNFVVRPVCSKDFASVELLVKDVQLSENILQDLTQFNMARRDPDGTEIQAYVAECQKQIVGVAVIRREQDIEYLRSHYNIEDFIYFSHHRQEDHGHLHHLALNPIFSHLTRHFLKEILRLSNKTCLYYPTYPVYTPEEVLCRHSMVCCLGSLVPVHARQQIRYDLSTLGINAPTHKVLAERRPHALGLFSNKLVMDTKETVNARIVVVGASDVALSFLESLAYCSFLNFNNLLLLSPNGLPGELPPDALRDGMMPTSHCYSAEECAMVSLRTWVNVVHGSITAIDRKRKFVTVDGTFQIPYDHLVLSTGWQLQVPNSPKAETSSLSVDSSRILMKNPPSQRFTNLFIINDAHDADSAIQMIQRLEEGQTIIIYGGENINAYCCIQTLLALDVPGSAISWVHSTEGRCFEDKEVTKTMSNALRQAKVQTFAGAHRMLCWYGSENAPDIITSASFTSEDGGYLSLECQVFFAFSKKAVDPSLFKAVNDAHLVFDGKLVIDADFHTNDVSIRAAGPLTKYHRHYHADQQTHACFNSREVGMDLALKMMRLFDTTLEPLAGPAPQPLNLLPIYRTPRVMGALLPGGYHFLEVRSPGLPEEPESVIGVRRRELVTGEFGSQESGYMKLGISQYQTVDYVLCLSKKPLPVAHFIALYGVHQRILNNLLARYDEGLIEDFYGFFNESWCVAAFHDRFPDFRDEIRELLTTCPVSGRVTIEMKVRELLKEEIALTASQRQDLENMFHVFGSKSMVETHLLSFLAYNYYHLPMYAKPGML